MQVIGVCVCVCVFICKSLLTKLDYAIITVILDFILYIHGIYIIYIYAATFRNYVFPP